MECAGLHALTRGDKCVSVAISSETGVLASFTGDPAWGNDLGAETVYTASFEADAKALGDFQTRIER